MSNTKIHYAIYDGRYHTNPDKAICMDVCDTVEEAKENAPDYGDDCVIVKETLESFDGGKTWVCDSKKDEVVG